MALVYDHMRLHITDGSFYVESLSAGEQDVLVIDRYDYEINHQSTKENIPPTPGEPKIIYAIFGIIRLVSGPHLIVVTGRSRVGDLLGHTIWKVTKTEIISFRKNLNGLTKTQIYDNEMYLSMLEFSLSVEALYFSSSFDITHSMQRVACADESFTSEFLAVRADNRFFWNAFALQDFLDRPTLGKFTTPIMHGFITIESCFVNGRTFDLALISRRSTGRAGTRYNVRGLDSFGDAANYVETEQILVYARQVCSVVQTRGSIPLIWSQKANLKYKPPLHISDDKERNLKVFNQHFDSQIITYGQQVAINLVNHKGSELKLAKAFLETVNAAKRPNVTYEAFDFHKECGLNKWHRLSILMDRISLMQQQFSYFMADRDGTVFMRQSGVFRTNCMDCLDRTNVVQSLIARISLEAQLKQLGIFRMNSTIESEPELDFLLKKMWGDNADYCSVQYAGTGALKTDFTRTGKRTIYGMIKDGYNSAVRYYKNNFFDGFRQDSMDLILGNYTSMDTKTSPFPSAGQRRRPKIFFAVYILLSLFLIVALLSAEGMPEQTAYTFLWAAATFIVLFYVLRNGSDFVNYPSLVHVKSKHD